MPLSLADARIKLYAWTERPTDPKNLTVADFEDATELMCRINKADYQMRVSGNATVNEQEACKRGEGQAIGPEQYEGNLTPFWYLDPETGQPAEDEMTVADLLDGNPHLCFAEIEGPAADEAVKAGDPYDYFEAGVGSGRAPDSRFEGYSKRSHQLFIDTHEKGVVASE